MRRLRLRTLLTILVVITTIPIAVLAAWLIRRSSAQQEALIDRQNIEQARAVMGAVDQEVENAIASLNVLALLEPIDATPKIIARTRNEDKYLGLTPTPEFIARSRDAAEGSWRAVTLEGTPAYSAWRRSPLTGWTVGIATPAEPLIAPVRRSFAEL